MLEDEKLAVFAPQRDETTLIHGYGCGQILSQFHWAVFAGNALRIPTAKTVNARAALEASGYRVIGPGVTPQPGGAVGRTALPLPECGHCAAPYPRVYAPEIGEHCMSCGHPLRLVQVDPRTEARQATVIGRCKCGLELTRRQRFCRCGIAVPEPELPQQTLIAEAIDTVNSGWQRRRRANLPRTYTAEAVKQPDGRAIGAHEHKPDPDGFCTICQEFTGKPADSSQDHG